MIQSSVHKLLRLRVPDSANTAALDELLSCCQRWCFESADGSLLEPSAPAPAPRSRHEAELASQRSPSTPRPIRPRHPIQADTTRPRLPSPHSLPPVPTTLRTSNLHAASTTAATHRLICPVRRLQLASGMELLRLSAYSTSHPTDHARPKRQARPTEDPMRLEGRSAKGSTSPPHSRPTVPTVQMATRRPSQRPSTATDGLPCMAEQRYRRAGPVQGPAEDVVRPRPRGGARILISRLRRTSATTTRQGPVHEERFTLDGPNVAAFAAPCSTASGTRPRSCCCSARTTRILLQMLPSSTGPRRAGPRCGGRA